MDKPDKIWVDGHWCTPDEKMSGPKDLVYILATPERELASELVSALREVASISEQQCGNVLYSDSKAGCELALDDVLLIAYSVLDQLEGKG